MLVRVFDGYGVSHGTARHRQGHLRRPGGYRGQRPSHPAEIRRAGKPRQKRSPSYYQNQTPQQASLLRPLESALVGPIAGRSFAESVSYADTRQSVRRLAGLPERLAHIESLSTRRTPKSLAQFNAAYVLAQQDELADVGKIQ